MDQSRYRDKSYLVTYELTTDIFEAFDLRIDDIVPIRSVYMIYTDKGVKVLKKINYGIEDLMFINKTVEHIISNGYPYVVPFMRTIDGQFYLKRDDGIYVVLNLVDGREADYQNPIDLNMAAKALCRLHIASRGMGSVPVQRDNLYSWIPSFEKKAADLMKFKEIAEFHEIKSGFDRLYLDYMDIFYKDALESIRLLKASNYYKLCDYTAEERGICHHDLAYHNLIIDRDNNVHFLDFDFCILDLRVHDLANLIVKSIKNCNWDMEKARGVVENYCSIERLNSDEVEVLYDFLVFPQDFYDISKCYYMKTKKWDEDDFLSRLETRVGYYKDRRTFLKGFREVCGKLKEGM